MADWKFEDLRCAQGFRRVAGVDEAGRGPWAGPVVAAAVMIPIESRGQFPSGVDDSKALSPKERSRLHEQLLGCGCLCSVGLASVEEIDQLNILQATFLAMRRACEALKESPEFLLVDGKGSPTHVIPVQTLVKGDAASLSIAAASILAKVSRDRIMEQEDERFPGYGFARHKGYGTREHREALARLGVCPLHRRTFRPIREILETHRSIKSSPLHNGKTWNDR
ncbi:MAG: ribonuclease HII [Candidatus Methylacidiphilales bacterium]